MNKFLKFDNIKKDLSEEVVDKQEHLNKERFNKLIPKYELDLNILSLRPAANLINLMHWAKFTYSNSLKNKNNLQCYIHNKIVIDGSFLSFAEENDIKIECLIKDSIASWKTNFDSEHFMVQGIFKISNNNVDFLHCALFHKGNQNEDEVSFFVIVDDNVFEDYIKIRNSYDKWLLNRDKSYLEIHVVGGNEGYPYKRNSSWDDVYLEDILKNDIKNYVEGFLASRHIYEKLNVPWKTGALLWGNPGCGKSSILRTIISNYNFKPLTVQSGSRTDDDTITEAFKYASTQEPALFYIEDIDTLLGSSVSISHFLNLMDGVASHKGLMVIATANDLSKLKESIIDRPSRFDRKWEIPLPNKQMTIKYLLKWFGDILKEKDIEKIAKKTVEMNFSYAYLKELYMGSVYNALADGREIPNIKDIKLTEERMLKDKEIVKQGFETTNNVESAGFL